MSPSEVVESFLGDCQDSAGPSCGLPDLALVTVPLQAED